MVVIDRVQGLFAGVDETHWGWQNLSLAADHVTTWWWLLAEDWQVIIYRFMYRWINTWLNVVEHVMIEYRGMMSWLFPALELKKYNTMQYEVVGHHQSLGYRVQRMVFTGVTDSRSLCRDKLHFSQNVLCNCASATLCGATRCATALDQVQQSLWGSRTSHPLDFNGDLVENWLNNDMLG